MDIINFQKNLFLNNAYELKLRFYYYSFSVILGIICCYLYSDALVYLFVNPILLKMNSQRFIFTSLKEIFFIYLKLISLSSFILSCPVFFIQFYLFLINGLYKYELKLLNYFFILCNILFIIGFILSYNYIVPSAWDFFLHFEQKNNYFPLHYEAKLNTYLSFTINILISTIVCLQLPTIITVFLIYKNINYKILQYISQRKIIYIILMSINTLMITSMDFISQLIFIISFLVIYEISLLYIYYIYNLFYKK